MFKPLRSVSVLLLLCAMPAAISYAASDNGATSVNVTQQNGTCKGVVKDKTGEAVIGASVVVKGTTNGVITDLDGNFVLSNVPDGAVIQISYVGYSPQEVKYTGKPLDIILQEDTQTLDEVVVTALGIKRQKRSLGYSTTTVGGKDFTEARTTNIGNALSGKIAGVSVSGNATGPGGSSRVVIRGNASLTGNNQPLYVIDGVPFDNTNIGSAGQWGGKDMGDGLSGINPDDIADIQVLKGAAASALYGYRGGNGAILITTKSGQKGKPVSVEFNNNLAFDVIYDYRDFQDTYGQGTQGNRPLSADVAKSTETSSWGEIMDGGKAVNFLGKEYAYSPVDNWKNFYRTGINNTTTLAVSGASDKISYRFGVSNMAVKGILPNSSISQQGINMNTTYDISSKVHLMVNANYVFDKNKGRSNLSDGNSNTNAALLYHANSFDIRWLERENPDCDWGTGADGKELLGGTNGYFNNPYWLQYRVTNETNRNRLTGGMTLKYDIFDWLYIQGAVTRDGYNLEYSEVKPIGSASPEDPRGYIKEYTQNFSEMNLNYLIGFNKTFGDWSVGATFGGNRQRNITKKYGLDDKASSFFVPDFYSSSNTAKHLYKKEYTEYRVNSIYGTADLGYKNQVFLNLTGRNDWFSTLDPDNNHYFYPSIGMSWVFSDTFRTPDWFTFGKIRASYAAASNGTKAYQNLLTYKVDNYQSNGQPVVTINNSTVPNKGLKPVQISEWEIGLNLSFLDNRLSLDAAYYKKTTKDDIVQVTTSGASGFESAIQNVGEIRNSGVEVMVNAVPIHTKDFNWNSTFNIAYNSSDVKYLGKDGTGENIKRLTLDGATSRLGNVSVQNILGHPYGELVGYEYKRTPDGQVIFENGLPVHSDEVQVLGNGVYKVTGGWRNEFTYKNITLAFLIDFKAGAKLFSGTNLSLYSNGLHKNTLQGRGADGKGTMVGDGVMSDGKGGYVKNTVAVSAQDYWQAITNQNIAEEFVYNASFIKLRELSIGYTLPQAWLNKQTLIKGVTLSLVGRNLWTILKHTDNIDPESAYNNGNAQGLELNGYPATRNVGFNVNVKF